MEIGYIADIIGAKAQGSCNIRWLLTDSRSLCFPEETLFFAIRTSRNDGHNYIEDLYKRGVRNFVVNRPYDYDDANFLVVDDTLSALQTLAKNHRREYNIPIIGITGSNGKTMVKEWLYQLLSPHLSVTRSPRSYNSQIGVPLSVWLLDKRTDIGIFEAGISMPNEMDTLESIIKPTIGIMTCLGPAHEEGFSSHEQKCREKVKLFKDAEVVIYDGDDEIVSKCIAELPKPKKLFWSTKNPSAPVFFSNHVRSSQNTVIKCRLQDSPSSSSEPWGLAKVQDFEYVLPFIDNASIQCSYACITAALYIGRKIDGSWMEYSSEVLQAMKELEPIAMRLEVKQGINGCTLINDSYNSDINSLDIALDFTNRRKEGDKSTLIISDIQQSGMPPKELYAEVFNLAMKRGVTKIIGIGEEIYKFGNAAEGGSNSSYKCANFYLSTSDFINSDVFRRLANETILIKGSRVFGFEHITELLEYKVHETILEVNLNTIVDNLNHYRSYLNPGTKMVCMVKADAYGAGAIEVARTLQDHRVDYLAVAVADEGAALRKAGITTNIMVMNPEMTAFKTMFDYDLEPEVYSFRILDALIKAASKEGITSLPVHVKIDTGMHRLGFEPSQTDELVQVLKQQSAIIPRSVFSHFVGSDSDEFDDFSAYQYDTFMAVADKLQTAFDHHILRHIDNSAGISHFPERQLDMCRLGIGLYLGASTLKTTILQLRNVSKEDTVGYSRKGILNRDSVIAALPIGYADGLDRHLGNGHGYCIVNGQKAPYVGNICMDVSLVDVTGIACKEGDMAEIFGSSVPVTVLSDTLGTIPYEVLTSVSPRVKRVYVYS